MTFNKKLLQQQFKKSQLNLVEASKTAFCLAHLQLCLFIWIVTEKKPTQVPLFLTSLHDLSM